jgi:hypothetical protein
VVGKMLVAEKAGPEPLFFDGVRHRQPGYKPEQNGQCEED